MNGPNSKFYERDELVTEIRRDDETGDLLIDNRYDGDTALHDRIEIHEGIDGEGISRQVDPGGDS